MLVSKVRIHWKDMEWNEIKFEMINRQNQLPVDFDILPLPFSRIIKDGFAASPISRILLEDVKTMLDEYQNQSFIEHKPTCERSSYQQQQRSYCEHSGMIMGVNNTNNSSIPVVANAAASVSLASAPRQHRSRDRERGGGGEFTNSIRYERSASGAVPSRQQHHQQQQRHHGTKRTSRESSSFSEGIASLNDAINSQDMAATLNSLEEDFDKISDPSTTSYIYCDAYK